MIAEAGHYALVLALALALIQSVVPIIGARRGDVALMEIARSTALAQLLFVAVSFMLLVALHVISDFSVANVFENSHSLKPLIYKITGVWGNHEGSMLPGRAGCGRGRWLHGSSSRSASRWARTGPTTSSAGAAGGSGIRSRMRR